ncbi:MAG: TetR/AcrR family transcriptional regulator [Alphaproteobacteria bacterium]|nr:TetR/AcrR family transcriptional regulator [Alphaproteobacteria bacterium]
MTDAQIAREILMVFIRYGFKKTSMADISRAAGLSRQSIYNRFGSKEAVFEWVVEISTSEMLLQVRTVLSAPKQKPLETLVMVYDICLGNYVPLSSGTGHGAEIMDLSIASKSASASTSEKEFASSVAEFILECGLAKNISSAQNKVFVLNIASKGLFLVAKSTEEFSQNMRRIIATTLG